MKRNTIKNHYSATDAAEFLRLQDRRLNQAIALAAIAAAATLLAVVL